MSDTFQWCLDKNRLAIYDKQVFYIDSYGTRCWRLNEKLHRENGPAIEIITGYNEWLVNGKRHRINGPAIEFASGRKEWYLDGEYYPESAYWKEMNK